MRVALGLSSVRKRKPTRRGAAAVELALLLPILATLLIIAVDFCRLFYHYTTIANCARNGALYASEPATAGDSLHAYDDQGQPVSREVAIRNAALHDASNLKNPTPTVGFVEDANSVAVTVSHEFPMLTSYLGFQTVDIERTVRMNVAPVVPGG